MFKKNKILILLAILMSLVLTSCNQNTKVENTGTNIGEATEYIEKYFELSLDEKLTSENINKAFTTIFGENSYLIDGDYTGDKFIKTVVQNGWYEELALALGDERVEATLKNINVKPEEEYKQFLACAIDINLVNNDIANSIYKEDKLARDTFAEVLYRLLNNTGVGRNFLGYISDDDIGARLNNRWESFLLFADTDLNTAGYNAVKDNLITGFNLKASGNNSNFILDNTIVYGHSDIIHAHQLRALLEAENINGKIQLEPKISIYNYLLEWGPIPESTPTYEVVQDGEDYFVHAVEYDLAIEFKTKEDMDKFNEIIEEYAKKYEGNEEGEGLIYASWWQPLYSTTNSGMNKEEYMEIRDCVVKNGIYELHTFTTVEDIDKVKEEFAKNKEFEVNVRNLYVNKAFFNYLTGADFQ